MNDALYCYPGSDVLKNKLGIQNPDKLHEVERKLTALRIYDLTRKPIQGKFDLKHLCDIHFFIFQDLYTWAGSLRKVDIAKGNMFCKVMFLEDQAQVIFGAIRKENYLEGLNEEQLAKRLSFHFSEINHYELDFSKATEQEMLDASVDSFLCKYERMEALFAKCLRKI